MLNLYLQLELHRQNIWNAGHHKKMANFKSVAYVHKRCWSKYENSVYKLLNFCHEIDLARCSILRNVLHANIGRKPGVPTCYRKA